MRSHLALRAFIALSLTASPALAQPRRRNAPVAVAPAAPYYDTAPLIEGLRPSVRADVVAASRLARLDALPYYDLRLTIGADGRSYTLHEELWFTNNERTPLNELVLRLYGNATVSPPPSGSGAQGRTVVLHPPIAFVRGSCPDASCTVTHEALSVLAVRPTAPIAPGGHLRVALDLTGNLPEIDASRTNIFAQGMESLSSLGASESNSDYGLLARGEGITSLANFYAVLARRQRNAWDRAEGSTVGDIGSDDLANVRALIDTPAGYTVATTGTALHTTDADGRHRVEVGAAAVRDFAVLASPVLQIATRRVGDVEVRSFFLAGDRAAGERVLDVASHALEDFERRFGTYPYVDLDVVEAPLVGGAGGVEFPGLVTVASMFYHPPRATGLSGALLSMLGGGNLDDTLGQMLPAMLEFVTAHEVAHQYWHGLVGSDSRLHPFVDESLAQFSAALYLEDRYGAERATRDANLNVKMNYQFMRMLGHADGPVDRPVAYYGSPMRYAGIVYGKGPYYYNALRAAATDPVFFRALRRYVDTWRFRTAPPSGFVDALVAESPSGASRYRALARHWLEETHGDDDLGQADLGSLMGGMLGGQGGASPELQQAIQQIAPMLQQLNNGQNGLPGGLPLPRGNGANGTGQPNTQEIDQAIQQILREAGGAE